MIKQKTILEVKVGERSYQMECSPESPLGELHDALSQMKAFVIQRMVDAEKSREEPKEVEVE